MFEIICRRLFDTAVGRILNSDILAFMVSGADPEEWSWGVPTSDPPFPLPWSKEKRNKIESKPSFLNKKLKLYSLLAGPTVPNVVK